MAGQISDIQPVALQSSKAPNKWKDLLSNTSKTHELLWSQMSRQQCHTALLDETTCCSKKATLPFEG